VLNDAISIYFADATLARVRGPVVRHVQVGAATGYLLVVSATNSYHGQAEANEETTSQTAPAQSPSERSSAPIKSAPGLIHVIPRPERPAS
jgi:hypothetical protein